MKIKNFLRKVPNYPMSVSLNLLLVGWTIIILGISIWTHKSIYSETLVLAHREAYKGYEKDVMFREWATKHGGVYVPITEETQPNPYLSNISERDITTTTNKKLTLMNPAYITRQVHELSFEKIGIKGHITSLQPIRKENKADQWETKALNEFEKGAEEYSGFDYINGEKHFRFMAPLFTTKGCLKCHADQGYKIGDIRGGISSTVPWENYNKSIISQSTKVFIGYGILWFIGFIGISMVKKKFIIYITRRYLYEEEMQKLNEELMLTKSVIEDNLQERNSFIEEITSANEKLSMINSEKDKFFSIIAHDLKSPFVGLIGLTEIVASDPESFTKEELYRMNGEIHSSAKNLFKLLQNLLEWSQMQKGIVDFNPQKLNLAEVVKLNSNLLEYNIKQKEILLESNVNPAISVFADENMLNSILRNLLTNAIKFTARKGKVFVGINKHENNMIEIFVSDTGIGMSSEMREKLFKIEEKVGRKGTDGEQSTGLGLMLCKEFVEKHGGKIWVESEEGKGSKFIFSLPTS
jgi:signal transduction histidine kinase